MMTERVISTEFHQCMYGLTALGRQGLAPAYKPTRVLTNHPAITEALSRRCDGNHRHAHLVGKSACSRAAHHLHVMCKVVLRAVDVIKKSRAELDSYVATIRGVEGELAEPRYSISLFSAMKEDDELEDMCQEGYDWHWQEDQDLQWKGN